MSRRNSRSRAVVIVRDDHSLDQRRVLPLNQRRLNFGDKWSYAPAPEANNYIKIRPRYPLFINGKFVAPRSGKYFDSINPPTEGTLAEIAEANPRDVDLAVTSARRAHHKVWGEISGRARGKDL